MSTPPPPPPGDATPPPTGPAAPAAMAPNAQFGAPVAAKSGGAKKIIFILIGVLALGGLVFAGYKYGPELYAKYFGGGDINTPDGAVKYVLNGLANDKPEVLWEALPAKHQKLIHAEIKKAGANVDDEIYKKSFDVLKKATGILKNKKTLIQDTFNAMAGQGGEGLPPELLENWDNVVGVLEIVVNSKASDPVWIKNPDVGAMLKEDGGKLFGNTGFVKLMNTALKEGAKEKGSSNDYVPESWDALKADLKVTKVTLKTPGETNATVTVTLTKGDRIYTEDHEMVKVGERWLPKEMAEGMDKLIAELKREMPMGQMLGSDTPMSDQQKTQLLGFLNTVDKALDTINSAADSNELMAAVGQMMGGALGQQLAGLEQAFGGGGGGGSGGGGIPGIRPGIQPGTNPGTIIPGLAPTGPPKPPGYKTEWSTGGGKYKIDEIYPGKPEAIITQVFGDPDQKEGEYWTYRGLKVRNMKLGGTYTTVIFQMQNGKVAQVIVQP